MRTNLHLVNPFHRRRLCFRTIEGVLSHFSLFLFLKTLRAETLVDLMDDPTAMLT